MNGNPILSGFDLSENDRIIFETIKRVGCACRSELVNLCALPRTTVYDVLVRLERYRVVECHPEKRTTCGRPTIFYQISKS